MARCERKGRGEVAVAASLAGLFAEFRGCFSAWTFPVFEVAHATWPTTN